jgi:DNA end-binding protein Ku
MRAIASLVVSFGLVSIPVKVYSALESTAALRFKLMSRGGAHVRQQYVRTTSDPSPALAEEDELPLADADLAPPPARRARAELAPAEPAPIEDQPAPTSGPLDRGEIVKGFEFEKGQYVLFTDDELKALQTGARDSIDIVAFVPAATVEPLYHDKAYLLAPDRRGERTYALLLEALQRSTRSAIGRWAWKGRERVVQIRPAEGGLVLQQLHYADEVRTPASLRLSLPPVGEVELDLALQLIAQGAQPAYDPAAWVDEAKLRIRAAVEAKIAGRRVVTPEPIAPAASAEVIDLLQALKASLQPARKMPRRASDAQAAASPPKAAGKTRRRATLR